MSTADTLRRNMPPIGAAIRSIIVFTAVLSLPLAAAQTLGLSPAETSSWVMAFYGVPSLLALYFAARYRQPLVLTGNIFWVIFIAGLAGRIPYAELVGAAIVAGVVILLIGVLRLTSRLAALIPIPIVFGLLAGAVLPFVAGVFTAFSSLPLVVGSLLVAYLLARRFWPSIPAVLPAAVVGVAVAALAGQFGEPAAPIALQAPQITLPVFSLPAIVTVTPVFVVLAILQANLPSLRFLESKGYDPPEANISIVSGIGTALASFMGPTGISLSLPATSLVADDGLGEPEVRYRAVLLSAGVAVVLALLAGIAVGLVPVIGLTLLLSLAGLAVVDVLAGAVKRVAEGPLVLGPLFTFAVALSDMSFLGFGPYFWALAIGTGVSLLLEREGLRSLHAGGH